MPKRARQSNNYSMERKKQRNYIKNKAKQIRAVTKYKGNREKTNIAITIMNNEYLYKFVDWFMASFLYCFPYSYHSSNYCSSNYCNSNRCRSFTLLKALAKVKVILSLSPLRARKSDIYRYCDKWKSDNFRERAIKKQVKGW